MAEQTDNLIAKLDRLDARFEQIEKQIADPAVAADSVRLVALSKEQGKLRAIVSNYRNYKRINTEIEQAGQILAEAESSDELKALATEELTSLQEENSIVLKEITNHLVMANDIGINSVIMEIRAGTGGEEAALFARDLYNMYIKYADSQNWKVENLSFSHADMGGFREVIIAIKGEAVWSRLGYEGGGHRVQRVPETESQWSSTSAGPAAREARTSTKSAPPSDSNTNPQASPSACRTRRASTKTEPRPGASSEAEFTNIIRAKNRLNATKNVKL